MPSKTKIKAGALLSVLTISLIIALLLGFMLLLLLYNRKDTSSFLVKQRLERNLQSGTLLLLADPYQAETGEEKKIDLFNEEQDSISTKRYPWGIYEVGIIKSFQQRDTLSKAFIIGKQMNQEKAYALYLKDDERPLSLSGSTMIRGMAYLPPAGVRKAYIEDKAYEADSTIYGAVKVSEKSLPALNQEVLNYLEHLFYEELTAEKDSLSDFHSIKEAVSHSFYESPSIFTSEDSISLENIHLKGAILIVSKKAIYIPPSAHLKQTILVAPTIHIADEVQGDFQAFARDSIVVGQNCLLNYPSALGILEKKGEGVIKEMVPEIKISKGTKINGLVFTVASGSSPDFMNRITLDKESVIIGQVYADGLLQLKGSVHGSVACQRFMLQTSSSLYDNFLLDAVIDYTKLSRYYLGSPLINTEERGGVLKWLH